MKINLVDVYVDDIIKKGVCDVLDGKKFVKGENLKGFEEEFAENMGVKFAIGISSGTAGILLSLLALGLKPGDEVLVPSHTFIATATPAKFLGAELKFVDIDPQTYTIDATDLKKKVTKKSKFIIPVHLYGQMADMDPICEIASENEITIIEDACQAHLAEYKGKKAGSIGDTGVFSFYPSKNMTVCGDGGMVTTNDADIAEKIGMLRDHGRKEKYLHEMLGLNFRLGEILSLIGREQLRHLGEWTEKRRENAKMYNELLSGLVEVPFESDQNKHVYHMYVIQTEKRYALQEFLSNNGISCGIHYPVPLHMQPVLKENVELPVTEGVVERILSLPVHPGLDEERIKFVAENVREFTRGN